MKILFFLIIFQSFLLSCGTKEINKNNVQTEKSNFQINDEKQFEANYEILKQIPHDINAYTQGLIYYNDYIYESTGHYKHSSIRKINPETGEILQKNSIPDAYFGEGITILNNKIYMLTWESRQCLILNIETFKIEDIFSYSGEGWGLANDGTNLIMSNGTNIIKYIEPNTHQIIKTVSITMNNKPISLLNELEYINGMLWANIYGEDKIAEIDLESGNCKRIIDFSELRKFEYNNPNAEVLNGIAYNEKNNIFYLTGKNWENLFKMKIN